MSEMTACLLVAAVLLLTAANWFYVRRARAAAAKPQIVYGQANCRSYVPPEWGDYKGSSDNYGWHSRIAPAHFDSSPMWRAKPHPKSPWKSAVFKSWPLAD